MKRALIATCVWLVAATACFGGKLFHVDNSQNFAVVVQVIDADNMIVVLRRPPVKGEAHLTVGADGKIDDRPAPKIETLVWVESPTAGIIDDQPLQDCVLEHSGTKQYVTADGTKTVPKFKRLDEAELARRAEAKLIREWLDKDGKAIGKAKFLKFAKNEVHLQKDDGSEFQTAMSALGKDDQKWVKDELKKRNEERKAKQAEARLNKKR